MVYNNLEPVQLKSISFNIASSVLGKFKHILLLHWTLIFVYKLVFYLYQNQLKIVHNRNQIQLKILWIENLGILVTDVAFIILWRRQVSRPLPTEN